MMLPNISPGGGIGENRAMIRLRMGLVIILVEGKYVDGGCGG